MNQGLSDRLKSTILWTSSTIMISLIFTFLMAIYEPETFTSISDVLWWWILTISGTGADVFPTSLIGRILASIVILTCYFLFALVISEVTTLLRMAYEHRDRGIVRVKYKKHIVIFGYTSLTAGVIKLLRRHFGDDLKIVLATNEISRNPFPDQVDFIFANPITKTTFREANTKDATAAIILANDRFNDPDAYSLVIATAIEKENSNIVTLVEIMKDELKELFKKSNIDSFIDRKELLNDLLDSNDDPKLIRIINKQTDLDDRVKVESKIELI